jgi:hypothetical protein
VRQKKAFIKPGYFDMTVMTNALNLLLTASMKFPVLFLLLAYRYLLFWTQQGTPAFV